MPQNYTPPFTQGQNSTVTLTSYSPSVSIPVSAGLNLGDTHYVKQANGSVKQYVWDGSVWIELGASGGGATSGIQFFTDKAAFPASGAADTIYVDKATGDQYIWDGTNYVLSGQDDVQEYPTQANFPTTGESGVIYIDASNGNSYTWNGTAYVSYPAGGASGTGVAIGESLDLTYNIKGGYPSGVNRLGFSHNNLQDAVYAGTPPINPLATRFDNMERSGFGLFGGATVVTKRFQDNFIYYKFGTGGVMQDNSPANGIPGWTSGQYIFAFSEPINDHSLAGGNQSNLIFWQGGTTNVVGGPNAPHPVVAMCTSGADDNVGAAVLQDGDNQRLYKIDFAAGTYSWMADVHYRPGTGFPYGGGFLFGYAGQIFMKWTTTNGYLRVI